MKAKKLEKIFTKVIKKSKKKQSNKYKDISPVAESKFNNDILFTESSDEVKKKSRNMILRLLGHRDEIQFHIDDASMNLHSENKISPTSNKSFYFHLEIIKGVGFILNCNEKKILLRDISLFDDIKPKIEGIFTEINLENFNNMYAAIMKENKLNRESNLDDILGVFL